jgi:heat shock protein HslJ
MKPMCFFIVVAFLLFSCEHENDSIKQDKLVGTWKLDSILIEQQNNVNYYPDTLDKNILIVFINSSEVNLFGYCNSGTASYNFDNSNITFENISLTEKACPFVGGEWEKYLYELKKTTSYKLMDSKLNLYTITSNVLSFSKVLN